MEKPRSDDAQVIYKPNDPVLVKQLQEKVTEYRARAAVGRHKLENSTRAWMLSEVLDEGRVTISQAAERYSLIRELLGLERGLLPLDSNQLEEAVRPSFDLIQLYCLGVSAPHLLGGTGLPKPRQVEGNVLN